MCGSEATQPPGNFIIIVDSFWMMTVTAKHWSRENRGIAWKTTIIIEKCEMRNDIFNHHSTFLQRLLIRYLGLKMIDCRPQAQKYNAGFAGYNASGIPISWGNLHV
jgi:hypothetical protein